MKTIANKIRPLFWIWLAVLSLSAYSQDKILLPHGFVTYSRGEDFNRVICRAEIAPGMTYEQIHATERVICEKGEFGGDITTQISFDGKWVAFARSLQGTSDGSGGNDYSDFDKWDIYIARVDGDLPVTPIRIGHGFFPSWGDDSREKVKTLYYSRCDGEKRVCKVKIDDKGNIVEQESVVGKIPEEGYEGFIFAAPNGQFAAYRKSSAVYTYWFEGPNKGKAILMTGGCHPHVTADSRWVYHANRNAVRSDGSARGEAGAGGLYHYGSSNDMNWFVTRTEGDNTIINKGRESWLCTLYQTDTEFKTEKAVMISKEAGFIDIHVFDDAKSRKAAKNNKAYWEKLAKEGLSEKNERVAQIKGFSASKMEGLPVSKAGESFIWQNDKADNRIVNAKGEFLRSCRLVPQGLAYIGQNGRIVCKGGNFYAPEQSDLEAIPRLAASQNQFSAELELLPYEAKQSGPARILTFSNGASLRDFTIGQEGDHLVMRLRTTVVGNNGVSKIHPEAVLGKIEANQPYHLIVSFQPGTLVWRLNGKLGQADWPGDLTNWENMYLQVGDERDADRKWLGEVRNIRLYAYALSAKEQKKRYAQAQKRLNELIPEKPVRVKAKLVEESVPPTIEQLNEQGYKRCLTTRHFLITEVLEGKTLPSQDIVVKEWCILDLIPLNRREVGKEYELSLYDTGNHKELDNEYTVEGLSQFDLPVYYSTELSPVR